MSFIGLNDELIESVEDSMHMRLPLARGNTCANSSPRHLPGCSSASYSGNLSLDKTLAIKPVSSIIRASIVGVLTEQGIPDQNS